MSLLTSTPPITQPVPGATATRTESDSLGALDVPNWAYYGVQTERGRQNFEVSGDTLGDYFDFIQSLARIKQAAALANHQAGALPEAIATAIVQAAEEIIAGEIGPAHFPVDMIQGGGGVSTHMNINEVLANRANEILTGHKGYDFVHPNNHVNMSQSTNDVVPSALKLTLFRRLQGVIAALRVLEEATAERTAAFADVVKLGRTCLQDAVPMTLGQEFSAYLSLIRRRIQRLQGLSEKLLALPLGGTAVGTSLGTRPGYLQAVYPHLQRITGLPLRAEENFFDGLQNGDVFVEISAALKATATGLSKMATDLRMLSTGNRSGMGEIILPAVQAGSSIMPGKINPSMPELINQIAYMVVGNDVAVTMAVEGGELELNVWEAIIAKGLFDSCRMLDRGVRLFATKAIRGLQANAAEMRRQAENSLSISTVLSMIFGYSVGTKAAKYAYKHNLSVKEAAVQLGILSPSLADELLDPMMLTDAERSVAITQRFVERHKARLNRLIRSIDRDERRHIFDVMLRMAWADEQISREEQLVMQIAAEALRLKLSPGELNALLSQGQQPQLKLDQLTTRDREFAYLCAAWLAIVDDGETDHERDLLFKLRVSLDLDFERAEQLREHAQTIRSERAKYQPLNRDMPYWEDMEHLLVEALHISSISRVPLHTRELVLRVLLHIAHVDQHISHEESVFVDLAADALQLPVESLVVDHLLAETNGHLPDLSALDERGRELVYLSAAWLAFVDGHKSPTETEACHRLREALELSEARAADLHEDAAAIWQETRDYYATEEHVPWWNELEYFLLRALGVTRWE